MNNKSQTTVPPATQVPALRHDERNPYVAPARSKDDVPQNGWAQDLLRDHPENVAPTLRRMQTHRDPARFTLVTDLCKVLSRNPSKTLLKSFTSTRLILVIVDIAADKEIYTMPETQMKTLRHFSRQRFINSLFNTFPHLLGPVLRDRSTSVIEELLRKFPLVWKALFETATSDLSNGIYAFSWDSEEGRDFRSILACVASTHLSLHMETHDCPPSVSSFVAHVLMYCWAVPGINSPTVSLTMFQGLFEFIGFKSASSVDRFLKEVSAIDKEFANKAIQAFIDDLGQPLLTGPTLAEYSMLAARFVRAEDVAFRHGIERNLKPFVMALASAYQREMCSGEVYFFEGIDIKERMATYLFSPIQVALQDLPVPNDCSEAIFDQIFETAPVVLLISESLLTAVVKANSVYLSILTAILATYGDFVETYLQDYEKFSCFFSDFNDAVRECWPKTRRILQKLKKRMQHSNALLDDAIVAWDTFGRKVGLPDGKEADLNPEDLCEQEYPWTPRKRCHWQKCLCHKLKSRHYMRVCKGCWRVFYCNSQCQASDWKEGGHRAVCTRRKTTPS